MRHEVILMSVALIVTIDAMQGREGAADELRRLENSHRRFSFFSSSPVNL